MSDLSDYLEDALNDHVNNVAAFTQPAGNYLAFFTAAPSDAGGGTEVTGGGYARQSITWGASSGGEAANTNTITFTASGADWGDIVAIAEFDAVSGGNMLRWKAVDPAFTMNDGDSFIYNAGDLLANFD